MEAARKRKNYPGDTRTPGTKDFAVIMGNLMGYRNMLFRSNEEQEIGSLMLKTAEKLKELGFTSSSDTVKRKVGRRKQGLFQGITLAKRDSTISMIDKCWEKAKSKHDSAKAQLNKH